MWIGRFGGGKEGVVGDLRRADYTGLKISKRFKTHRR